MEGLLKLAETSPAIVVVTVAIVCGLLILSILLNVSIKIGPLTVGSRKFTDESLAAENRILRSLNTRKVEIPRIQLMRQMALTDEAVDEWVASMSALFRQFTSSRALKGNMLSNAISDNDAVLREQAKVLRNTIKVYHRQNGYAHMEKHELADYVQGRYDSLETALINCRMSIAFDKDFVGTEFIKWRHDAAAQFLSLLSRLFERCAEVSNDCEAMADLLQVEYRRVELGFSKTGKILEPDQKCFSFDKY